MNLPLMPKATAVWLIENTALTFKQIADFCGLLSVMDRIIAINGVPVDRDTPNFDELLPSDDASAVIDLDFNTYTEG